mmetsp:Transcript_6946/g.11197  ORF Transcript_6946/g.11197 Transcript_6946/m.11197 type:complete len:224 (-) Transcript_6946:492-1163(-)
MERLLRTSGDKTRELPSFLPGFNSILPRCCCCCCCSELGRANSEFARTVGCPRCVESLLTEAPCTENLALRLFIPAFSKKLFIKFVESIFWECNRGDCSFPFRSSREETVLSLASDGNCVLPSSLASGVLCAASRRNRTSSRSAAITVSGFFAPSRPVIFIPFCTSASSNSFRICDMLFETSTFTSARNFLPSSPPKLLQARAAFSCENSFTMCWKPFRSPSN